MCFTTAHTGYVEAINDPSYWDSICFCVFAHRRVSAGSEKLAVRTYVQSILARGIEWNEFFEALRVPVVDKVTRDVVLYLREGLRDAHALPREGQHVNLSSE